MAVLLLAVSICQASGTSPAPAYCSYRHESCLTDQTAWIYGYRLDRKSPLSAPRSVDIRVIFRWLSVLSVGWPVADIQSPDTDQARPTSDTPAPATLHWPLLVTPSRSGDVKLGHNHCTLYFIFPRAWVTRESVIQEVTQPIKFFLLPSVATILFTIVTRPGQSQTKIIPRR